MLALRKKKVSFFYGARGSAVVWGTSLQDGKLWARFPIVLLEFFIDVILRVALQLWGWLSLQQEWVLGIFPCGVETASAYGWQLYHLHVPTVSKSGIFNLREPSWLVQACTRIALPLPLQFTCFLTLLDTVYSLPRRFAVLMAANLTISPLGYDEVQCCRKMQTFLRNLLSPPAGWKLWIRIFFVVSTHALHYTLTLRRLMSYIYIYIYGAPILDVSRSHTTTQHSR